MRPSWWRRRASETPQAVLEAREQTERLDLRLRRAETENIALRSYVAELEAAVHRVGEVADAVLERTAQWTDDEGTQFIRGQMVELYFRSGGRP